MHNLILKTFPNKNPPIEEQENPTHERNDEVKKSTTRQIDPKPKANALNTSGAVTIPCAGLQVLDEEVKSMMEKGQKMIPGGTQANGTPKQTISWICKLCGKEGLSHNIRDHIEANHLEGISFPCEICEQTFTARINLNHHRKRVHN